jgi:hypothetical protein
MPPSPRRCARTPSALAPPPPARARPESAAGPTPTPLPSPLALSLPRVMRRAAPGGRGDGPPHPTPARPPPRAPHRPAPSISRERGSEGGAALPPPPPPTRFGFLIHGLLCSAGVWPDPVTPSFPAYLPASQHAGSAGVAPPPTGERSFPARPGRALFRRAGN